MTVRGYPIALLGMAVFLVSLSANLPVDVPLGLFALFMALSCPGINYKDLIGVAGTYWAVVGLVLACLISVLFSLDAKRSLLVVTPLLPALLCFVCIQLFAQTLANRRIVYWSLAGLAAYMIFDVLQAYFFGKSDSSIQHVRQLENVILVVPNDILLLAVISPLLIVLWQGAGALTRVFILGLWLLSFTCAVLLASRQGVVLLFIGWLCYAFLTAPKKMLPVAIVTGVIGIAIDASLDWALLGKVKEISRLYVWHVGWLIFLDYPITGAGPGLFKDLYAEYLFKAGYVLADLPDRRLMPWAHNLYLEQLLERGIIGFCALLCFMAVICQRLIASIRRGLTEHTIEQKALLVSWAVLLLAAIGELTFQRLWVVVLMLVVAGLVFASTRNSLEG